MSVMPLNSGEIVYMENDRKIRYSHVNDRFREGNLNFFSLACTINTWSTNTTIASYHGHGPNNNVSLYVIYHPLALIKTSTILLRMVFMVSSLSLSRFSSPYVYAMVCCSRYSSLSHLSNSLFCKWLSWIKLCNVIQAIMICFLSMSRESWNTLQNALLLLQDSKSPLNDIMKRWMQEIGTPHTSLEEDAQIEFKYYMVRASFERAIYPIRKC